MQGQQAGVLWNEGWMDAGPRLSDILCTLAHTAMSSGHGVCAGKLLMPSSREPWLHGPLGTFVTHAASQLSMRWATSLSALGYGTQSASVLAGVAQARQGCHAKTNELHAQARRDQHHEAWAPSATSHGPARASPAGR